MDHKAALSRQDVDQQQEFNSNGIVDEPPTISHKLASQTNDQPQHGTAQVMHHGVQVQDLGWDQDNGDYDEPLMGNLSNEELWTLVRRFNKQMFHVKATEQTMASPSSACVHDLI